MSWMSQFGGIPTNCLLRTIMENQRQDKWKHEPRKKCSLDASLRVSGMNRKGTRDGSMRGSFPVLVERLGPHVETEKQFQMLFHIQPAPKVKCTPSLHRVT